MENTCENCSKIFHTYKSESRRFCTMECFFESKRIIRKCPQCGIERKHQKNSDRKDFCSLTCWSTFRRKRVTYTCKICNKEIEGHPSKPRKTCSKICSYEYRRLPEEEYKKRRLENVRKYRKNNRDKTTIWKQNRRSRELGAKGSFTEKEWVDLKTSYNNLCAFCKLDVKLTVDHIIPLCKGGSNSIDNIQPLCMPCNSKKHIKIM